MTAKQEQFLAALFAMKRMIPTKAAREAGYAWPDKSGPRLMQYPEIKAAVDAERERRSAALKAELAAWREERLAAMFAPSSGRRRRRRSRV